MTVAGMGAAVTFIVSFGLPAILSPPGEVHRMAGGMFTISYSIAVAGNKNLGPEDSTNWSVGTVLQPLAASVDMHPVSFAIIGIVALAFGLVTPPYGLCLMISCAIAKVRLRFALKDTMIMLVPMLLVLSAMIVWPEIPLILPRWLRPEFLK